MLCCRSVSLFLSFFLSFRSTIAGPPADAIEDLPCDAISVRAMIEAARVCETRGRVRAIAPSCVPPRTTDHAVAPLLPHVLSTAPVDAAALRFVRTTRVAHRSVQAILEFTTAALSTSCDDATRTHMVEAITRMNHNMQVSR